MLPLLVSVPADWVKLDPLPIPQPAVAVLAQKVVSGLASAHAPTGCIAANKAVFVYVSGRKIRSATFFLDGHKLKTVTRANVKGRYGLKIRPGRLGVGVHRVRVTVVFSADSKTQTRTLHVAVFHCRPPRPEFTG